jgi:23S rRNA (uracil1939-C5)-methyltransferase
MTRLDDSEMAPKARDAEIVRIEELGARGDGVGHIGRLAVFVGGTAPGDLVEVERGPVGQGRMRARLREILEPSSHRVVPFCARADRCGGCRWMHVAYEAQLEAKSKLIERAFRTAGLDVPSPPVKPSPRLRGYRRRARLSWRKTREGLLVGFAAAGSHRLVDVTAAPVCPVLEDPIRETIPVLRDALEREGVPARGNAMVLCSGDQEVQVALKEAGRSARRGKRGRPVRWRWLHGADEAVREKLSDLPFVCGVGLETQRGEYDFTGKREVSLDSADAPRVLGTAFGFVQANRLVNEQLREMVVEACSDDACGGHEGQVLELFAGSGNLTARLAARWRVRAVERDADACRLMEEASGGWPGGSGVEIVCGPARREVENAFGGNEGSADESFRVVVVDPPRRGMREIADTVGLGGPPCVVYVSCDPMTCARDVSRLSRWGYELLSVTGLDTMPHTPHLELVAVMTKKPQASRRALEINP